MHHHTKFGCILLDGTEDIFWTKVWQTQPDSKIPLPPPPRTMLRGGAGGIKNRPITELLWTFGYVIFFPNIFQSIKAAGGKVHRPVTGAALCSVIGVIVLGQRCWGTPIHVGHTVVLICGRTWLFYWHHACCFRLFPQLQHLSEEWQVGSCCAHSQLLNYIMKGRLDSYWGQQQDSPPHGCSARLVPIHLVGRAANCCQGLISAS